MRISSGYQAQTLGSRISDAQSRLYDAQQAILTQKKFQYSRENPSGSRILLSANSLQSRLQNLSRNYLVAKEQTGLTETAYSDISTALSQARSLGLQANNSSVDDAARTALAKQVDDIKARILSSANTADSNGDYVFAGQSSKTKPFVQDTEGKVSFAGDDLPLNVEVKPGELLRINASGAGDLVKNIADALDSLKAGITSGKADDALATIEKLQPQLSSARAENGVVMNRLETIQTQNQTRIDDLAAKASDIQEIDYADAMTQYQSAQTAYEAALRVVAGSQSLSLMNFLQ